MNFTIEYLKELEEKDDQPGQYVSRWTDKIQIHDRADNLTIIGYPVFYVIREGAADNTDYFSLDKSVNASSFKVSHSLTGSLLE